MPSVLIVKNNIGEKIKIPLRNTNSQLLFTTPNCKWGDIMAKQFEKKNQSTVSDENQLIIYKEGETPTFSHSSAGVYYISDKNLDQILETIESDQRPVLITINAEGKITKKVTSWLELM